jgi:site-specific DNA-cytosine methylase
VATPQTIDCIEWCFGYGGNHLGIKRVVPSLRCIAASEIETYACANLVAKMEAGLLEPFPIWTDLKTFPCEQFRNLVDIFIASYPCQPFSSSGQRKGADDPRHLWPYVRRAAEIIRPRFVFFENVEGHVSLGLREVLTELALLGYRVENSRGEPTWGIFSSAEVGAPQNRKRVFILGMLDGQGVDQVDALCEQVGRFYTGGFFNLAAGTGSGRLASANRQHHGTSGKLESETGARSETDPSGVGLANTSGQRFGKGRSKLQGRHGQLSSVVNGTMANSPESQRQEPAGKRNDRSERSFERSGQGCHGDGQAVANRGRGGEDWEPGELRTAGLEQPSGDSREANTGEGRKVALGVGQADSDESGLQGGELIGALRGRVASGATGEFCGSLYWPGFIARPGQEQFEWEPSRTIETKRGLGGGVNGRAANVDRLRLLGNGVYPVTAAKAFCELMMRFKR